MEQRKTLRRAAVAATVALLAACQDSPAPTAPAASPVSLARSAHEERLWRLAIEHGIAWCDMELAWLAKARREATRERKETKRWTQKAK